MSHAMRTNPVKRNLQGGGRSLGTMVMEFDSTGIARLADATGAEFVLYDMESIGVYTTELARLD